MLSGPNQSGVFTVDLNSLLTTDDMLQTISPTGADILPDSIQQVTQQQILPLSSASQLVNLTPVKASLSVLASDSGTTTSATKTFACSFCNKNFSSRYNVSRHGKICKQKVANVTTAEQIIAQKSNLTTVAVSNLTLVTHTSHGRYLHICKYCAKEFSTKWNVMRHERMFHDLDEPIIVPQSAADDLTTVSVPSVDYCISSPGKPERYCRKCGYYFSSKHNANRHEKICVGSKEIISTGQATPALLQQQHQESSQVLALLETVPPEIPGVKQQQLQQQQIFVSNPLQISSAVSSVQTQLLPVVTSQSLNNQQIQQRTVQEQSSMPQQCQITVDQSQANFQIAKTQQLVPQQTMLMIEQRPVCPFHVCKFCNKQLTTQCEPFNQNPLPNVPLVSSTASITGQPAQFPAAASILASQLTGLVPPALTSISQVTFVQPQIQQQSNLPGQLLQQTGQPASMQSIYQSRLQSNQPVQRYHQQANVQQQVQFQQQSHPQMQGSQQQISNKYQIGQLQQQNGHHQQERLHACRYCKKQFATKSFLDQHEKNHTGKANTCKLCEKCFVTPWVLEKHMEMHISEDTTAKKPKHDRPDLTVTNLIPLSSDAVSAASELVYTQHRHIDSRELITRQVAASAVNVSSNEVNKESGTSEFTRSIGHARCTLPSIEKNSNHTLSATSVVVTSQIL